MDGDDAQDIQGQPRASGEAAGTSAPDRLGFQDHQASMVQYLIERVPEYRRLSELRRKVRNARQKTSRNTR